MTTPAVQTIDVPFLAPVPAGNVVLVVVLRQTPEDPRTRSLVLDQTARVLYCDERLLGPLGGQLQATIDPVAVLSRWTWVVARQTVGRVMGAIVPTKAGGDDASPRTRLFVETSSGSPYR